ncbi:MAG: hypothetical protein P8J45_07005 [Phycisphaerales bacterium]|jgi:hypothetical protein|nr:hypothetical protein [Phycisphaerales bacterium]
MSSHDAPVTEQIDDPESGWTWFLSLASMVVFIVTVAVVIVLFYAFEDNEIKNKVINVPAQEMTELRTQQKSMLDQYQRYSVIPMGGTEADAESRIRIPVEQAMEVMVAESRNDQAGVVEDVGTKERIAHSDSLEVDRR